MMLILLAIGTVGAFATLGDGKASDVNPAKKLLLVKRNAYRPGSLSLRPNYSFRGSQVIANQDSHYINLTTSITYQSGHTSYTVPLKKRVLFNEKIVFNPNASTRR